MKQYTKEEVKSKEMTANLKRNQENILVMEEIIWQPTQK